MELTVTQHYESQLGPFEKISVDVLNDRYGRITTTRLGKRHNYAFELATLAAEPEHRQQLAWHWLGAAVVMLLGLLWLIYSQGGEMALPAMVTGAALLLLTLIFIYAFITRSAHRLVFHARFSGVALVELPIPVSHRRQGNAFAEMISILAQKSRLRLHLNDDELRAGELRMLHRLSEEGNLALPVYNKARTLLLQISR